MRKNIQYLPTATPREQKLLDALSFIATTISNERKPIDAVFFDMKPGAGWNDLLQALGMCDLIAARNFSSPMFRHDALRSLVTYIAAEEDQRLEMGLLTVFHDDVAPTEEAALKEPPKTVEGLWQFLNTELAGIRNQLEATNQPPVAATAP